MGLKNNNPEADIYPQTSKEMMNENKIKGIDIVFQNISYSVQVPDDQVKSSIPCKTVTKQRQILKGITGIFKSGKTTAIMGASGAGKTTLLNILACRIKPNKGGKLSANNFQYNYQNFGDFANYVMQSDVLMQTLTVRETLQFAAQLKLDLPQQQRKLRVGEIANRMKLEKCLDTLVGGVILKGISGGQKKRTSIAFQLISDPQVVFLDEPTSGLDSLTSYIIVSELKRLTRIKNKTVIMTIHQPNSQTFQLFDNLTVLLQGKVIFQSQAKQITNYFSKNFNLTCPNFINPSDYFMSKIHYENQKNRQMFSHYFQAYSKEQENNIQKMIQQKGTHEVALREVNTGLITAMSALVHRNVLNTIRNPMLIKSKIFQGIFLALFIGGIFFDIGTRDYTNLTYWYSITGFLFFMTINSLMSTLAPLTLTFPSQRDVFFKQQDAKMYNVVQYFLAKNFVQIPELIIIPLIIVSIYYFMIDLGNTAGQFFFHCLVFFLMSFCGASLGLLLGSAILDAKSVSAVTPIMILPIILFSGFFKNRQSLPVWIGWIQYISPNKYGFSAFILNQVSNKSSNINLLNLNVTQWEAIIILFALGIFFRILSLFFLWALRKKTQ